jgi:hypothetical protein
MHVSFYTTLDSSAIASNITRSNISFAENFPYKFGFGKNHMSFDTTIYSTLVHDELLDK